MAQLVVLVSLILVVASAFGATAHKLPATPDTFSLKCIVHNLADRCVSVGVSTAGKVVKEVEALPGSWTAIAPVAVSCASPVVHVCATVTSDKGVAVTKSFPLDLLAIFKLLEPKCFKTLAITACESISLDGSKCLEIKIGLVKELSFAL